MPAPSSTQKRTLGLGSIASLLKARGGHLIRHGTYWQKRREELLKEVRGERDKLFNLEARGVKHIFGLCGHTR